MIIGETGDVWQLFAVLLILTLLGEILTPIMERPSAADERASCGAPDGRPSAATDPSARRG